LRGVTATGALSVRLLGVDEPVAINADDSQITITLPEALPLSAVHVLRLMGTIRPAS
jgi:hypothetical protein